MPQAGKSFLPASPPYAILRAEIDVCCAAKAILPPEAVIQNQIANPEKGPQKPWWKTLLEWILYILFLAGMFYLVKYFKS